MFKIRLPPFEKNAKINGKSTYALYLTYKNHFSGKYNAVKYGFNINVSNAAFDKRKDKYFFNKLANKYTFIQLIILFMSNSIDSDFWIGDVEKDENLTRFRNYLGKINRITEVFSDDIKNLFYFSKSKDIKFKDILYDREKSYLLRLVKSDIISSESVLLLDSIFAILDKYEKDDIVWSNHVNRLISYRNLTIIDAEKTKELFKQLYERNL